MDKKGELNLGYLLGFFSILLLMVGSASVIYGYYTTDTNLMGTGGIAIWLRNGAFIYGSENSITNTKLTAIPHTAKRSDS